MQSWWLALGVLVLASYSPVAGELLRGQPDLASVLGQTGTEASPTGPLAAPHPGWRDGDGRPEAQPSRPGDSNTDVREEVLAPTAIEPWREIAGSLRALVETLRQLPQQIETRFQLVQRASQLAYTAGRWRGWLEGGGVVGALAILWVLVSRRRSATPTA